MSSPADSDRRSAAAAFARVFDAFEPFGRSFAPAVARRLLIYPTNPFGLGDEELLALMTAAAVRSPAGRGRDDRRVAG